MVPTMFLLVAVFVTGFFLTGCTGSVIDAQKNPNGVKRYGVEKAVVLYKLTGAQTGAEELYFDNWGMHEAKYTTAKYTSPQGREITAQQLQLLDEGFLYGVDLIQQTVRKAADKTESLSAQYDTTDLYTKVDDILAARKGKKTGTDTIAGKECDVWELQGITQCMWKGIPLRISINTGSQQVMSEATEVTVGEKIPAEKFIIPFAFEAEV